MCIQFFSYLSLLNLFLNRNFYYDYILRRGWKNFGEDFLNFISEIYSLYLVLETPSFSSVKFFAATYMVQV